MLGKISLPTARELFLNARAPDRRRARLPHEVMIHCIADLSETDGIALCFLQWL